MRHLLAADPDERRAPGAPFVSRAWEDFSPFIPLSQSSIPRRRSNLGVVWPGRASRDTSPITVLIQPGNSSKRASASRRTLEWQHDAQLSQQAPDAVEGGGALLHETLAGAVHQQLALLLDRLDGHEAHVGPGNGLADGSGIGCIIFASLARDAISSSSFARGTLERTSAGLPVASTP